MENLVRAWKAGVPVVTGTDSGNPLLLHGPAIHRELQLWVKAGIPAPAALQAATYTSAKLLRIHGRTGRIQPGYDATLLIIDGNPLAGYLNDGAALGGVSERRARGPAGPLPSEVSSGTQCAAACREIGEHRIAIRFLQMTYRIGD